MASSVIVPVRKAVIAGVKAAVDRKAVHCSYGYEGYQDDSRREQVWTGRPRATHDPAALKSGRNFREERMDFDLTILVKGVGLSSDKTDDKAMAIGLAFEEWLADRKNNELGVAGLQWIRVADMELNNLFAPDGTLTELTYTIRYAARLT